MGWAFTVFAGVIKIPLPHPIAVKTRVIRITDIAKSAFTFILATANTILIDIAA